MKIMHTVLYVLISPKMAFKLFSGFDISDIFFEAKMLVEHLKTEYNTSKPHKLLIISLMPGVIKPEWLKDTVGLF